MKRNYKKDRPAETRGETYVKGLYAFDVGDRIEFVFEKPFDVVALAIDKIGRHLRRGEIFESHFFERARFELFSHELIGQERVTKPVFEVGQQLGGVVYV